MKQDKKEPDFTDWARDQIVAISKAGAYDAIAPRVGELQEQNNNFRKGINEILDEITAIDPEEFNKNPADFIIKVGNICNQTLRNNRPL